MRLCKISALFAVFAVLVFFGKNNTIAQSVSFSDLRLVHNVPDNNGRQMLQFHYKMTVTGCQGHNVKAYMFVDIPQGTGHKYANGNNMVASANSMKCTWESTSTTGDWWIGIYNDQLNPLPGKKTYYTRLWVKDENTGKWIGYSNFLNFDMTGNDKPVAYPNGQNYYDYSGWANQYGVNNGNTNNNQPYNNQPIYNDNSNSSYNGRSRAEIQNDLNNARDFLNKLEKDKELLDGCYSCQLQHNQTIAKQKKWIRELEIELSKAKY